MEMFEIVNRAEGSPTHNPFRTLDDGQSMILYRGTVPGNEVGMAWTTCCALARWYSAYWIHEILPGTEVGCVYRTVAPQEAVLCVTDWERYEGRQNEREVIIDPRFLLEVEEICQIGKDEPVLHPLQADCSCVNVLEGPVLSGHPRHWVGS